MYLLKKVSSKQLTADAESALKTSPTYNNITIQYRVKLIGTYVTDQSGNIVSTNIGAEILEQFPSSSKLQAYVRGWKTTFSGKVATTTVTIGFEFNNCTIITSTQTVDIKSYGL